MAAVVAMGARSEARSFLQRASFVVAGAWLVGVLWWFITPFGAVGGLLVISFLRSAWLWREWTRASKGAHWIPMILFFLSAGIFLIDALGAILWPPFWTHFWANRLFEAMAIVLLVSVAGHLAMRRDSALRPRVFEWLARLMRVTGRALSFRTNRRAGRSSAQRAPPRS
jgi:hypothetical protein